MSIPKTLARMSFESDRQHLLDAAALLPPDSSAASFVSVATATDRKGRAVSPSTSTADIPDTASSIAITSSPYRGFPSEQAYLAALRAWADERQFVQLDTALVGWYGTKTKEDYLNQPGLNLRSKSKARKEEKRRATIAGEGRSGHSAAPASKSQPSAFRWPRRATLSKLTQTTTR